MAKQNKSWEDQLSTIYTDMTGVKVDFAKKKETTKRARAANRKHKKFIEENGIQLFTHLKTNANLPGFEQRHLCDITIAVVPVGFVMNPRRLDAPCEMCINRQCPYSKGYIPESIN